MNSAQQILWIQRISKEDINLVGKELAEIGELTKAKIPIPPGFVITSQCFENFLIQNNLEELIRDLISDLSAKDEDKLHKTSFKINKFIINASMPQSIEKNIIKSYLHLEGNWFKRALIKVRQFQTNFTLSEISTSVSVVHGEANLLKTVKDTWANQYSTHNLKNYIEKKIDPWKVKPVVFVQQILPAQLSGSILTISPIHNEKNLITIEARFGFSDKTRLDQMETPDIYEVNKFSHSLINKNINKQLNKLEYDHAQFVWKKVPSKYNYTQKVPDNEILELSTLAKNVEQFYFAPQSIDWIKSKGKFYITARREMQVRVSETKAGQIIKTIEDPIPLKILCEGVAASPGIKTGIVKIIKLSDKTFDFNKGEILAITNFQESHLAFLKKASAIITDYGSLVSDYAIICREIGIPCIVGVQNATKKLRSGQTITADGTHGKIYHGSLKIKTIKIDTPDMQESLRTTAIPVKTATKIDCLIDSSENIIQTASLPVDGVGKLAGGNQIHNKEALISYIASVCRAFNPRSVMYYLGQITEDNLDIYSQIESELEAIKYVRNNLKFINLHIVTHKIRSISEMSELKKILASENLIRKPSFQIWLYVSSLANILELEQMAQAGIDGISVDLDQIKQLLYGFDKPTDEIENQEISPALEWSFTTILKTAHKLHLPVSVFGNILSKNEKMLDKLIRLGVSRIIFPMQEIEKAREMVAQAEKNLLAKK